MTLKTNTFRGHQSMIIGGQLNNYVLENANFKQTAEDGIFNFKMFR